MTDRILEFVDYINRSGDRQATDVVRRLHRMGKNVCNNCGKVLEGKEIGTHNTLGEGVRDVDTPKK